jgi:carboxyl-terminal processing protease
LGPYNDLPRVEGVRPEGPARRAGLQPGDLLTELDGHGLVGVRTQEVMERLRGPVGQPIDLAVRRDGASLHLKVDREHRTYPPLSTRVVDGVGVIRVTTIPEWQDMHRAVDEFMKANPDLKGMVLDLRGSPGGLLDGSIQLADELLDGGEVVEVRGRDPKKIERYNARPGEVLGGRPVVVLIDQNTASGAEIVAAALQDRHRARIVGLPSFGTGIIYTIVPLHGGRDGALRMLSGLPYRLSGAPLQKVGVTPDVMVAQSQAEADKARSAAGFFSEAALHPDIDAPGARPRAKPGAVETPPAGFSGDYQEARALELVRSMIR